MTAQDRFWQARDDYFEAMKQYNMMSASDQEDVFWHRMQEAKARMRVAHYEATREVLSA